MYYDFSLADYVGVSWECNICHVTSPELRNLADMIGWADQHQMDCEGPHAHVQI